MLLERMKDRALESLKDQSRFEAGLGQSSESLLAEVRFLRAELAQAQAARQASDEQLRTARDEMQSMKTELLAIKDERAKISQDSDVALQTRAKEMAVLMKALKTAQDRVAVAESLVENVKRFELLFTRVLNAFLKQGSLRYLPKDMRIKQRIALMERHSLFDAAWYLEKNPDVAQAGVDPAEHYVLHGLREGRSLNRTMDDLRLSAIAIGE